MSTVMLRVDEDEGPVAEFAGSIDGMDDGDFDALRTVVCAMAGVPVAREVLIRDGMIGERDWRPVVRVIDEHTCGGWYVAFLSDCFDPPLYLVRGQSLEDAFDEFLVDPLIESYVKVDHPEDYGDPDTWHFNDNGVHVDDESVHVFRVSEDRVRLRAAGPWLYYWRQP